ncbi:unnamed protein product [Chondrus crispus]|uniref:Uncharacterized protein n=1 Tax=Chondrus crispus TaxID=2769 RepID=R7QA02_CHOCR|nr:unnamed protein product [Chondrus crispus]CDF34593.1 unnamed protein product [Chondrus crispus]|eukprot:XP_005714412.1 unnamed protein product [Chondrus crispus]
MCPPATARLHSAPAAVALALEGLAGTRASGCVTATFTATVPASPVARSAPPHRASSARRHAPASPVLIQRALTVFP